MKTTNLIAGLLSHTATAALAAPKDLPGDCPDMLAAKAVTVANAYFFDSVIRDDEKFEAQDIKIKNVKFLRSEVNPINEHTTTFWRADFAAKSRTGLKAEGKAVVEMTRGGCMVEAFQFTAK